MVLLTHSVDYISNIAHSDSVITFKCSLITHLLYLFHSVIVSGAHPVWVWCFV